MGDFLLGTIIAGIATILAGLAVAAVCIWFLYTIVKTLIVPAKEIGGAIAKSRGEATLSIDPRLADGSEIKRLRQISNAIAQYSPHTAQVTTPQTAAYRSILGFLPIDKVPGLDDPLDGMFFFSAPQSRQGFFTVQHLTPAQKMSDTPFLADLVTLMQPNLAAADALMAEGLKIEMPYPGPSAGDARQDGLPNFGRIPMTFDIPEPELDLPLASGPMAIFNPLIIHAHRDKIQAVEKAQKDWREAKFDFDELMKEIRGRALGLKARIDAINEQQQAAWQAANQVYSRARRNWEERFAAERAYLGDTVDRWHAAFLDDPVELAKLTLGHTLFPRWLPQSITGEFDRETRVLIVEQAFPDIGQITWQKHVGDTFKAATKAEVKDANERLYPALALRYAWEVARCANENLVKTIVINGWADYIDRTTGETKRAYVSSLLADVAKIRALKLPSIEVLQAFAALKGVTARAQTVTPVAPIVAMDTTDRRFVDARNVMDGMSSEQNLATMDWGDFEHLCRQLFEKEFAAIGAEVRITQASRDQGVDAVIFDPDPIRGGKIVVQAKRYAGTVDVSAVRDLWGTTQHEGAMKGILVTTSQYGSDAYNFAAGKPMTLINGGQLLQILDKHGYRFRIDLAEAKKAARERYASTGNE